MTARRLRPRTAWLSLSGAAVALLVVLLSAMPADAHAALVDTSPFDGQVVDVAPDEVTLTFNEPVNSPGGGLRVYDTEGSRVDTSQQGQPSPDTVSVGLPDDVDDGTYVATYRVTSADGHVIRGAFVFDVGEGDEVSNDTLAAIFGGGDDTPVAVAAGVARAVGYGGALLAVGALLWWYVMRRQDVERARARRWAARGALAAIGAALVAIPAQAMLTSGEGLSVLGSTTVLTETVASSVGIGALLRLGAFAVVLVLVRGGLVDLASLAALVGLGSFLVDGHTRTVDPAWVMILGDATHLLAASAWLGGLVLLAVAVRERRQQDDPVGAAQVVAGFSRVATWSLVALVGAGSAMSWALVRQPRALTSTDYGWTLLLKVLLVGTVILVGAYNNRRLLPAITRAAAPAGGVAWAQLRRTVTFEVGALVAVLAVTAFLVNLRPAAEEAGITGAFDTYVSINDDLDLNLVVDPNVAGFNEIHLYVLDRTGRPVSDLDSVVLRLSQPERDIGPIEREPFVAGPGHWQVDGRDLAIPGEWIVEVVAGVDRFTEASVEVPVFVNSP